MVLPSFERALVKGIGQEQAQQTIQWYTETQHLGIARHPCTAGQGARRITHTTIATTLITWKLS